MDNLAVPRNGTPQVRVRGAPASLVSRHQLLMRLTPRQLLVSSRLVPLPSPVAAVLKTHRSGQVAERLAALVWAPWEGHEDLVVPHGDWDASRPTKHA